MPIDCHCLDIGDSLPTQCLQVMNDLRPLDLFHFRAAEGWMELGNNNEASAVLDKISRQGAGHPEVQRQRWDICAGTGRWGASLAVADSLIMSAENDPLSWLLRACSLHKLGFTESARDCLLTVLDEFPRIPKIHYDLAVYECQLGRPIPAMMRLQRAFVLGDSKKLTMAALRDPDLKPLFMAFLTRDAKPCA